MAGTSKKIYFVGARLRGQMLNQSNYCVEAENKDKAIEKVRENYKKYLREDSGYKIEDIEFTVREREEISMSENFEKGMIQYDLDRAVDNALDNVKYLIRGLSDLVEKLELHREFTFYNENGEIQGAASSVEIEIGKITALQKVIQRMNK